MSVVVVVGDVMVDILVRAAGPVQVGTDTAARIRPAAGGSGANQAAWLARAGMQVVFLGRVGAADYEEQLRRLRECGVDARLGRDAEATTGTLINLISADGERSFLTDRGANSFLCADDLAVKHLEGAGWVHVSAYSLYEAGPRAAVMGFWAGAWARGLAVSVDPASSSLLREVGVERFLEWTRGAGLCVPNADEAAVLAGTEDVEAQLKFLAERYETVVIKRGAEGAVAARGAARWSCGAPVVEVLDTTGAGDAFLAGFLAERLRGAEMQGCLEAGVKAGSAATLQMGGRPG
jgi:sugar/nucleoside kinase (ribokinase family)